MFFVAPVFAGGGNTCDGVSIPCKTHDFADGFGDVEFDCAGGIFMTQALGSACFEDDTPIFVNYTCNTNDNKWYRSDDRNYTSTAADRIVEMKVGGDFFAQSFPVCKGCGDKKYNALTGNGNNRQNICCDRYEVAVNVDGNMQCGTKNAPHESFYVYGKEVKCDSEKYPVKDESETNGYKCSDCPKGYYCEGYKATICDAGKYTDSDNSDSCYNCDKGYFCPGQIYQDENNNWKNANGDDISYISEAVSNPLAWSGQKIPCPQGYYSKFNKQAKCTKCPSGTTNAVSNKGNTSCDTTVYSDIEFGSPAGSWKWPESVTVHNALEGTIN